MFFLVWLSAAVTWFSSAECAAWWRSTAAWPSTGGLPDWRMGFADLTAAPDGLPRPRGHCWQLLRLFRQLD